MKTAAATIRPPPSLLSPGADVSVGLIRTSPQRKLHKSLKCQTLRHHHSRQMGFFSRLLPFGVFFFFSGCDPPGARGSAPMLRTDMPLFKAAPRKEKLFGSSGAANKVEPTSSRSRAASCWVESKSRVPRRGVAHVGTRLTPDRPPCNTGPAETPLQLSNPRHPWSHTRTCPQLPCERHMCDIINKIY